MEKISFAALPFAVRLMTALSMFMTWVMIAEFIIDRHGFDRYLPLYRLGSLCPYDGGVAAAIVVFWIAANRR